MSFPATPKIKDARFKSRVFSVRSESLSGRTQSRSLGGQRFEFIAKYPVMKRAEFMPVFAFLSAQGSDAFEVILPVISEQTGDASGTALTVGSRSSPITSYQIDGFTGTIKAGSIFKFANHDKIYMATADRDGPGSLLFWPPLQESTADNEEVIYDDVPIQVRHRGDIQEYSIEPGDFYEYEMDLIEAT